MFLVRLLRNAALEILFPEIVDDTTETNRFRIQRTTVSKFLPNSIFAIGPLKLAEIICTSTSQDALDDKACMLVQVYGIGIHIPKKFFSENHLFRTGRHFISTHPSQQSFTDWGITVKGSVLDFQHGDMSKIKELTPCRSPPIPSLPHSTIPSFLLPHS